MFKRYFSILILSYFALIAYSCTTSTGENKQSENAHAHEEEDHQDHSEEEVELTQAQLNVAKIELGQLKPMNLSKTIQTTGRIILPSQHRASVNAVKGGQVTDIIVKPGEEVTKGQKLAKLRDPDFIKVQQRYLEARAQLQYLRAEYKRKEELYEGEVGAKKDLQQARAAYKTQQSHVERHATELRMLNLNPDRMKDSGDIRETVPLLAPINGIIQKVKVRIGQYLEPRSTLFTILEREHLRLQMMVYEKDIGQVAIGQAVYAHRVDDAGEPVKGRITGINHGMNEKQQGVEVFAKLETIPGTFKPGMTMEVQIVTDTQKGTALPNSGIARHEQSEYIFYSEHSSRDTMHFKRQMVRAGPTEGQFTAVHMKNMLPDGAKVVTHNAHYLLREMMEGGSGGHSH